MDIEEQLKQELAQELCAILDGLTTTRAAELLGVHPSRISELRNGRLEGFSIDRLIRYIKKQGYSFELACTPRKPATVTPQPPSARVIRYDRFGRPIPRRHLS